MQIQFYKKNLIPWLIFFKLKILNKIQEIFIIENQ